MLAKIAIATAIGTITSLAIGGAIAGIMSALTGQGFWKGFSESVQESALDALLMSFAITAVTVAVSAIASTLKCFAARTLVLCMGDDGEECHKNIEDVVVGDMVWAYNEETGESDWKPVVRLFRNTTSSWICTDIEVDGETETIKSTAEHPYYVLNAEADRQIVSFDGRDSENYNGQWVAAKDLKVGDKCLLSNGKTGIISKLEVEHLAEPEATYNFEVADFHTYYVGDQGILVHNSCVKTGKAKNVEIYDTFDEAFARAKELGGVTDDQLVSITQARSNKTGRFMQGKHYNYVRANRAGRPISTSILHHSGGHPQLGMSQHLNVLSQKGSLNYHLFYRGF